MFNMKKRHDIFSFSRKEKTMFIIDRKRQINFQFIQINIHMCIVE